MDDKVTDDFIHDKYGWCYYAIEKDNTSAIIYNLFTESEYRNQGHAKRHLQIVINKIRAAGYVGKIIVEVKPSNKETDIKRLSDFYNAMGLSIIISSRQAQEAPKAASQCAEELIEEICKHEYLHNDDEAIFLLESDRAAQRQAGREEASKKLSAFLSVCEPVVDKTLADIYDPESNGCLFCPNCAKVCPYLISLDEKAKPDAGKGEYRG